jgi:hypothetical protein
VLDARGHLVEGAGERPELVAAAEVRADGEVAFAEALRGGREARERPRDLPGERERRERERTSAANVSRERCKLACRAGSP